jgi:hypothetical protein
MINKRKSVSTRESSHAAVSVASNSKKSNAERIEAMAQVPAAVCDNEESLHAMLNVLRNKEEPLEVRLAALESLGAAAFSVIAFESCRNDYIAALREVAEDPEPELRRRVLGILAREKDGFAQKKLLEGLQKPEKALVSPEKALQFLGYDPHAGAYAAAREIIKKPPSQVARREALRLLAADAASAPLFEKMLRDKDELRENRQIAASALQALKPEKFREQAREMLLDKSEYEDIQATSLTALSQFGDDEAVAKDKELLKSVDRMSSKAASATYKRRARQFLSKYRR